MKHSWSSIQVYFTVLLYIVRYTAIAMYGSLCSLLFPQLVLIVAEIGAKIRSGHMAVCLSCIPGASTFLLMHPLSCIPSPAPIQYSCILYLFLIPSLSSVLFPLLSCIPSLASTLLHLFSCIPSLASTLLHPLSCIPSLASTLLHPLSFIPSLFFR